MQRLGHLFMAALLWLAMTLQAGAATLIRDADIEHALSELARPILQTAGLSPNSVKVLIIQDDTMNAFVLDNNHIFIHSGLLLRMKTAAMLQSVIAHEAAHIANGHMARRSQNMARANTISGLGVALAAAAAAASGRGDAAAGLGLGIGGSARRVFMSHTRAEESAADSDGLRYMERAGVDTRGFSDVLNLFRGQEVLSEGRQDPYARTHPLSRDRLRAVEAYIQARRGEVTPDPAAQYWFARINGKLSAFLRAPRWTLDRLDQSGTADIALMREAVAWHRTPDPSRAIAAVDRLVAMRPKDPFVHDLRGQILLESRQFGAAVNAYKQAAALAPQNALILAGYGRALLAADQPKAALQALTTARDRDFRNAMMLRDLAVAYARTGQDGMASLVTAERFALMGRLPDALIHANRALGLLPRGSAPFNRAQDVVFAAEAAAKQRR
ncbi:MAG: M48 family metalloprotease [Paracoccaceae bacterium]|jgi:predicted Zn-dependent protease|nr:M48 family metalloprotease [Paracoccaceae bacterium]